VLLRIVSILSRTAETHHPVFFVSASKVTSKLEDRTYLSVSEYPDAEMEALVSAAARMSGQSATVVLEDFGVFLAPPLLNMYKHLIPGDWKTTTSSSLRRMVCNTGGFAPGVCTRTTWWMVSSVFSITSSRKGWKF
jgi:hypothetical protein